MAPFHDSAVQEWNDGKATAEHKNACARKVSEDFPKCGAGHGTMKPADPEERKGRERGQRSGAGPKAHSECDEPADYYQPYHFRPSDRGRCRVHNGDRPEQPVA